MSLEKVLNVLEIINWIIILAILISALTATGVVIYMCIFNFYKIVFILMAKIIVIDILVIWSIIIFKTIFD